MAQLHRLLLLLVVAATGAAVAACDDSPASPSPRPSSQGPGATLPAVSEGGYRLLVTAAGASMGCEISEAGVPLGPQAPAAAGYFSQDVQLRTTPNGWSISPERTGVDTTLTLVVNGATWPESPAVTGTLAGRSDQRAYDGPAIDAGGQDRPAAFTGFVVPESVGIDQAVLTGTVNGRLTFGAGWTGQVTVCRSAQLLLQRR
jgi:hypothetical protein